MNFTLTIYDHNHRLKYWVPRGWVPDHSAWTVRGARNPPPVRDSHSSAAPLRKCITIVFLCISSNDPMMIHFKCFSFFTLKYSYDAILTHDWIPSFRWQQPDESLELERPEVIHHVRRGSSLSASARVRVRWPAVQDGPRRVTAGHSGSRTNSDATACHAPRATGRERSISREGRTRTHPAPRTSAWRPF